MNCCSKLFIGISTILGIAGTVMGIIALWKIYSDTDETPWCDACREMFKNNPENCDSLCAQNFM